MSLAASALRGGRLLCACPEDGVSTRRAETRLVAVLGAGFGLSALSQALAAGLLPLAAMRMVDGPWLLLPSALMLVGIAVASLPAALLVDHLGRREGLALGAAFGAAGGGLVALGITGTIYSILLLGAFWLGLAQGFGLFYRHLAAAVAGRIGGVRAVGLVVGGGAIAGIAGPTLAGYAEALSAPYLYAGSALLAAAAHVATIAVVALMPPTVWRVDEAAPDAARPVGAAGTGHRVRLATALASGAWLLMAGSMAAAPLGMAGCGIATGGIVGAMAWHVVAMYAPALVAGPLAERVGPLTVAAAGLLAAALGAGIGLQATTGTGFGLALGLVGAGWSFATVGATAVVAGLSRGRLALHDAAVAGGALAGVAIAAAFAA